MARLIDAKVLEKQVKATFKDSNPVLMGWMLRWVRKQPTIDAVPVVRCKDCAKAILPEGMLVECTEWHEPVSVNGYCHRGERRTDV